MADHAEVPQMNMELTNIPGTPLKVSPVAIGDMGHRGLDVEQEPTGSSQSLPSAPPSSMASTLSIPPQFTDSGRS